ncbi:hypothetical protein VTO73DRAFT_15354 [Trametes versicolor]
MSMDEVLHNLWVGDLPGALDTEKLRAQKIRSVLTASRGRLSVHLTLGQRQIKSNVDDTDSSDILQYFVPAVIFIQAELDNGHGVLVHCQTGINRSASIVAAYLMVSQGLDPEGALGTIRRVRPDVQRDDDFIRQLEIFYKACVKVSKHDKETRTLHLERAVHEVLNGHDEVETEMSAQSAYTLSDTPVPASRCRIICRKCRHELATRKFMLDHGQLGPSMHEFIRTPKTASTALDGSDAFSDYVIEEDSSGDEHPKPDEPDSEDDFDSASVFSWTTVGSAIPPLSVSSSYSDLSDLVARLSSPDGLAVTPMSGDPSQTGVVPRNPGLAKAKSADFLAAVSPSILINARCSGYFVQPMKWMTPFLEQGNASGKIICPNEKCGAKLGNYYWAGTFCSCQQWVTPAFCIARNKVEEAA